MTQNDSPKDNAKDNAPRSWRHPGFGRRRASATPKGRQFDPQALEEIRALLGVEDQPLERSLLIEYLHKLQDHYSALHARHLCALAHLLQCPLVEVYEVATFYAHFDVLREDEPAPPLTLRVCDSISCMLGGAEQLLSALESATLPRPVRILRAPCMGRCEGAPVAMLGKKAFPHARLETLCAALERSDGRAGLPQGEGLALSFAHAQQQGGYAQFRACLEGRYSREDVLSAVERAGLCGLGGAGFPSARKWRMVGQGEPPRLMAVNADEGEPGTFKDRWYLSREPHRVLEGMLIAAWVVEAQKIWFYLRDEYPEIALLLQRELPQLRGGGFSFLPEVELRRGAGAYICGEESAMLESLEGKRGLPRHKPPYPAEVGLFGRPTLIHNVETLYWIPEILAKGADWYSSQGLAGHKGLRSFSVSGRVRNPGVKRVPAGTTLRTLLYEHCGGMAAGHELLGYLPGGASGGLLNARQIDLPLDFGALNEQGCFVGSCAVVVFSDKDAPSDVVRNLLRFFEDESCGQCTPCRVGTEKAVQLMQRDVWDRSLLQELCQAMTDASICGLGQAAGNPILCLLKHFPEHIPSRA